jgi:hypothetical protein
MDTFAEILLADGPSPEIGEAAGLYGWLVGSWEMDMIDYGDDGSRRVGQGEVHFAWVLEGRAIQDMWIAPPRSVRNGPPQKGNRYGTTLRVYDRGLDAWRITWINPVTGVHDQMIGRKEGDDIVQHGRRADGTLIRWSFREITSTSFHWFGESSADEGRTWRLEAEFRVRRAQV